MCLESCVSLLQLQLTPLAGYSVPCSTVPMAAACTTASGHIFLGATDGNVYQVQYGKRQACRLACVSRSFLSMLGAGVLPGYLAKRIWAAVPIRLLAVDNDRHFLYTLAENHLIRVRRPPCLCACGRRRVVACGTRTASTSWACVDVKALAGASCAPGFWRCRLCVART